MGQSELNHLGQSASLFRRGSDPILTILELMRIAWLPEQVNGGHALDGQFRLHPRLNQSFAK
jgi:hypothetical protein